ncbi:MAG: hypothetical protein AAFR59_20005 [Bacteroidota bacterium]
MSLIGLVLSLGLTGCFDIEERITLNKNGTGNYAIKMDMSEMGSMIQSFLDSQSEEGEGGQNMFQTMDSSFQVMAAKLRGIEGISNVRKVSENYVFELSYDFDEVDRIFEAQTVLNEEGGGGIGGSNERQFTHDTRKRMFSRLDAPIEDVLGDDFSLGEEEDESGAAMAEMMLKDASYRTIYSFPGTVKKFSNSSAKLSADGKTMTLELSFLDLMKGNANIGNDIQYKKK